MRLGGGQALVCKGFGHRAEAESVLKKGRPGSREWVGGECSGEGAKAAAAPAWAREDADVLQIRRRVRWGQGDNTRPSAGLGTRKEEESL